MVGLQLVPYIERVLYAPDESSAEEVIEEIRNRRPLTLAAMK
jgi:hypothetical protein